MGCRQCVGSGTIPRFYDCNTLQFSDYSRYESSIFSEQDNRDYHAKYGKEMEEKACQLGRQLIQDAQKAHSR